MPLARPLCGKLLSAKDYKAWQQAIALRGEKLAGGSGGSSEPPELLG
jgi:hypothetical protein